MNTLPKRYKPANRSGQPTREKDLPLACFHAANLLWFPNISTMQLCCISLKINTSKSFTGREWKDIIVLLLPTLPETNETRVSQEMRTRMTIVELGLLMQITEKPRADSWFL